MVNAFDLPMHTKIILFFFTTIVYVYDMPYMKNFAVGKIGKFGK